MPFGVSTSIAYSCGMRAQNQVSVRDLVDEAKKRIVFLVVCVVGLSYIMSLTSSSVWVNLPAASLLIMIIRYFSLDFETRKKAAAYSSKPSSENTMSQKKPPTFSKDVDRFEWKKKVNSPIVEEAMDHFTRHLISEWVTDLWYSRLTPDKEGPEELINIINGALGEIAGRMRNINLIDLLTRDLINIICNHLENFRSTQAKIEKKLLDSLTIEYREVELKRILASEDKLHPALFSVEAQHKVLQHLTDGLISFIFKHEDLQCSYFRFTARELLASAVMRPILNLASPRFINERIEILVINMTKANKASNTTQEVSQSKPDGSPRIPSDHFSRFLDPSVTGVELVQLKNGQSRTVAEKPTKDMMNGNRSKDPLLFMDTRSSRSWSSLPMNPQVFDEKKNPLHNSSGEWGDKLDLFSRRKKQALAPEHFDNMWTKGKNYRKKEGGDRFIENVHQGPLVGKSVTVNKADDMNTVNKLSTGQSGIIQSGNPGRFMDGNSFHPIGLGKSTDSSVQYYEEDDEPNIMRLEEDSGSCTSYTTEDEESSSVTGLDSPGIKVWDGRSNRNLVDSQIHHPLENSDRHISQSRGKGQYNYRRRSRSQSGSKRYRHNSKKVHVWQEVERTTFLSGDGQDILSSIKEFENIDGSSDDSEIENFSRVHSGLTACSSTPSTAVQETPSFYKLRCEVVGANIVKSGSRTFAVYSIAVTDVNNNSWSIKRRFRHFEELHRRLKEFPEYDLHLPPKHFLSTGLDVPVIRERCKLLDKYLKKLMQLPTVSGFIEVWDFLSVDSQTYIFSNSFSILETLSVDLDYKPAENDKKISNITNSATSPLPVRRQNSGPESVDMQLKKSSLADGSKLNATDTVMQKTSFSPRNSKSAVNGKASEKLDEASDMLLDAATDPTLPTEWVPPNLSAPILDLVDVIFQLQDGGWIRRQAFWVAKQVLQLGMGDAFDDWLLEKLQLLRKGSVIASAVQRLERILWPDGIFITKHPKRRQPPPSVSSPQSSPHGAVSSPTVIDEQQQRELDRRAKFVYELMIDNAPAAIVGLVGRREYEQCAKDLYYFLQSNVCLKQLAFDLIELLLLTTFPELDSVIKQLQEDKSAFGELKIN